MKTDYQWNFHFHYQQNWGFNTSLIWQKLRTKRLFRANFKGLLFQCREISDHKYWWGGKNLSVFISISKSILKPGGFFVKILKVGKIKMSKFQKMHIRRPGNRKHSFFITWIFYQLTILCSNYAVQLKQMSHICEVWKN